MFQLIFFNFEIIFIRLPFLSLNDQGFSVLLDFCLILFEFLLEKESSLVFDLFFFRSSFLLLDRSLLFIFRFYCWSWTASNFLFLLGLTSPSFIGCLTIARLWLFRRRLLGNCLLGRRSFSNCLLGRRFFLGDDSSAGVVGLRNYIFFSKSKVGVLSPSTFFCEVVVPSVSTIKIIISFEPLCEFKVILIFRLGQFLNLQ